DREENLARLHARAAQIDRDRVFGVVGVAANGEIVRAKAARFRVAVIADDAAVQQNAREEQWRQRLRIDNLLAEIALAHVGDDAALFEKIIQPLALNHREPAAAA